MAMKTKELRFERDGAAELRKRSKLYALKVVRLVDSLPQRNAYDCLGRQLLKSATRIGMLLQTGLQPDLREEDLGRLRVLRDEVERSLFSLDLLAENGAEVPAISAVIEEARQLLSLVGVLTGQPVQAVPGAIIRQEPLDLRRLRMLLVEADPSEVLMVRKMLDEHVATQAELVHVERFSQALELLREHLFDVLLLDVRLPDGEGLELVQRMRRAAPGTPLVVLCQPEDEAVALQALHNGADDYLIKSREDGEALARSIDYLVRRRPAQHRIQSLAYYDDLTGLPNRTLLFERLHQALVNARRNKRAVAVLFLDLDRFKPVNDTLGHSVGDLLLKEVAGRLQGCVRESDTVARLGGDEFVVVLTNLNDAGEVALVAQKILDTLRPPVQIEGHEVVVTASIGISLFPDDGDEDEVLIRNADMAMYWAKDLGRNKYHFHESDLNLTLVQKLGLEKDLRRALENREFILLYQPQLDLGSGEVFGVEVLLRWQHPELGLMSPERFLPLAERLGLIVPIGEWVLRSACRQTRLWQESGLGPLEVAVNVSRRQFSPDLPGTIARVLRETGLDPAHLSIELAENHVSPNADRYIETLREIKDHGVKISIDDFGTGHTSLTYLRRLPVSSLKIDPSFIREVHTSLEHATIVSAIIGMAHGLELRVVAEGVEKAEQLTFLRRRRCDQMQGYYLSRPVSAEALIALVQESRRFIL